MYYLGQYLTAFTWHALLHGLPSWPCYRSLSATFCVWPYTCRRAAFHIHVGFDLAVELPASTMNMIGLNDFPVAYLNVCPPDIGFYITFQNELPIFINAHILALLYKCFPAPEALNCAKRLEIHHTQKHGSRLNIAEIELNAMTRQCLARRLMNLETVRKDVFAWESMCNEDACNVT